jgi:lipid-A-disaccharide synthase
MISAGEASGEMYGAQLIEALRRHFANQNSTRGVPRRRTGEGAHSRIDSAQIEFFGVGGEKMRAAGCDLIVNAKDLAVVGITEILGHLPKIWRLFHKLIAEADRRRPDLVIVIDSPAFNWRVAREMKRRSVPVVYYVCPQFWAWRQGRVRLLRKYVDKALVIFPFEERFYRDRGVNAEFVGHPLADLPRPAISREDYAQKYGLDSSKAWLTLMPGSRRKEARMNLPAILDTANLLGTDYEFLLPVAPTLDSDFISDILRSHNSKTSQNGAPAEALIHLVPDALPALAHSRAGIIASGTATVEAAMMEMPFVMVYRVTPLTYLLGRWTVKVPHFAMVNLIAGKEVVSEFVQDQFTAENVASRLKLVIRDGTARQEMMDGLRKVKLSLLGSNEGSAPDRAGKSICDFLRVSANS